MQKIQMLQVLRGIAALMVVFFHAHAYMLPHKLEAGASVFDGFNMGYAGVEIFFVISGFIMMHIHRMDVGQPAMYSKYIYKRAVRIYPVYLLLLFSLVGLYFIFPGTGPENARDIKQILLSATLLPLPFDAVMEVAWTLQHEIFFYFIFSLSIAHRTIGKTVMTLWAIGCCANLFFNIQIFPLSFIFSAYNLLFIFGAALAYAFHLKNIKNGLPLAGLGAALFIGIGWIEVYGVLNWYQPLRTVLYGISATLILSILFYERETGAKPPALLCLLGDASYSIYLTHGAALMILAKIAKIGPLAVIPSAAMFFAITLVSIAGGVIFYLLIEKNIARFFAKGRKSSPTKKPDFQAPLSPITHPNT